MADWFETRFPQLVEPEQIDPVFAARMRALVVDQWTSDPTGEHDADDREFDTEQGEIIMLETEDRPAHDEPGTPRRRVSSRWVAAAATVALVAIVGALLTDSGDDDVDTTSPVPAAPPAQEVPDVEEFVALDLGTWFVDPDGDDVTPLRVTFDVAAEGWESWLGAVKFSGDGHVALTITTIDNVVRHGCTDHTPADPPVGPTVDDLATALTRLAPFEVTSPPRDVTLLGYQGKHLQLTVPDLPIGNERGGRHFEGCTGGNLESWFSPIHDGGIRAFFGYNGEPGRTEDFWILDVDGTRLVLATNASPDSPAQDVAELGAIVESIRIEP